MKLSKLKAAGIAAGVAVFAFIGTPATAGTVSIPDSAAGVDFDAACLVGDPTAPTPGPNNVPSPGANPDCLVSTYDGSTEATDLYDVTMSTAASGSEVMITSDWNINADIPNAGSNCNPQINPACLDLPNNNFVGAGFKALFQNKARQNNTPTNSVGGGCPRVGTGTPVYDQHEHWADGYHHFTGFDVVWDGTKWIYSAQVGSYDPAPDGAFFFTELGTASSTDSLGNPVWSSADPAFTYGVLWSVTITRSLPVLTTISVLVHGRVKASDTTNCANGVFTTVYAVPGDTLSNIKGLSTADSTVTLPVTVPLSLVPGFSDITSVGGFIFYSDITLGNSRNNGTVGGTLGGLGLGNRVGVSYTGGFLGISDTLGDSPACPTPTFGGLLPTNPFLNTNVGCQYDDDNIPVPNAGNPAGPWTATNPGEGGTFLSEWWDTNHSVT